MGPRKTPQPLQICKQLLQSKTRLRVGSHGTSSQRTLRLVRPRGWHVRVDQGTWCQRRLRHAHDPGAQEAHHLRAGARFHGRPCSSLQRHKGELQQGDP